MQRHYLYAGSHRLHYRRQGEGPALVLLPAFPASSLTPIPLAAHLADGCTVLALDLPGSGESTALPDGPPTIDAYADWLGEMLDALGLADIDLMAFETSAPVAAAFSRKHPGRVRRLVLVEPPVLTEAERAEHLDQACPRLAPDAEGSHLTKHWGRLRDSYMFRPWFKRSLETRIYRDLPSADRLYDEMLDLLRAGPDYWHGSHAGWSDDWARDLSGAESLSILATAETLQRLAARGLFAVALDAVDDFATIGAILRALPQSADRSLPPPSPAVIPVAGEVRRFYAQTRVGQVLVRRIEGRQPGGVPLLLFHGSLWSSHDLEPKLRAYAESRPVLTLDVPGVGDSPSLGGTPSMTEIAQVVAEALDDLGLAQVDLQGSHSGAMIAVDVAILRPGQVRRVILDGVTNFTAAELAEMLPRYLLPLAVSDDGAFLNWSWQYLRDMFLWYPWYDHRGAMARSDARVLSPDAQHRFFVDFLKGGRTYPEYYRAALAFPTTERIALIQSPTLFCCSQKDTLRRETIEAAALLPGAVFRFTAGRATPEAVAATDALYLRFLDGLPLDEPAG